MASIFKGITVLGSNIQYLEALSLVLRETTGLPCTWVELPEGRALTFTPGAKPGIYLLDVANFQANAEKTIDMLRKQDPGCKVACLHHLCNVSVANRVKEWGADAYILKNHVVSDFERFLKVCQFQKFFTSDPIKFTTYNAMP